MATSGAEGTTMAYFWKTPADGVWRAGWCH